MSWPWGWALVKGIHTFFNTPPPHPRRRGGSWHSVNPTLLAPQGQTEPTRWREEGKDCHLPFSPRSLELRVRGSRQTCAGCTPGQLGWPQKRPCPWHLRVTPACVHKSEGRHQGPAPGPLSYHLQASPPGALLSPIPGTAFVQQMIPLEIPSSPSQGTWPVPHPREEAAAEKRGDPFTNPDSSPGTHCARLSDKCFT